MKKKTTKRPLQINKTTIRSLAGARMRDVRGGELTEAGTCQTCVTCYAPACQPAETV